MDACEIDPNALYPFREVRRLIPSCRGGCVSLSTLHTWRKQKRLKCECRKTPCMRYWFVRGAQILRILGGPYKVRVRSAAERKKAVEAAYAGLRELGVID